MPAALTRYPIRLPSGRTVDAQVRARTGTRRLSIRIDPVARAVVISMPPRTARHHLDAMASQYGGWVESRLDALPRPQPFVEGGLILLRGQRVRLERRAGRAAPHLIEAADGPRLVVASDPERFAVRVRAALKALAHGDALEAAGSLAPLLARPIAKVAIREARTRWGSCTAAGEIMLNWRLIAAPPLVLRYVVAHELAHLKELNHSPRFWAEVTRLMPGWKPARAWLKTHGADLHALGAGS